MAIRGPTFAFPYKEFNGDRSKKSVLSLGGRSDVALMSLAVARSEPKRRAARRYGILARRFGSMGRSRRSEPKRRAARRYGTLARRFGSMGRSRRSEPKRRAAHRYGTLARRFGSMGRSRLSPLMTPFISPLISSL